MITDRRSGESDAEHHQDHADHGEHERGELMAAITELVNAFPSDVHDDDPDGSPVTLFVTAFEDRA